MRFLQVSISIPISLFGLATTQAASRYASYAIAPGGLIPRFLIDRTYPLAKRDGDCGKDHHSCLDVGIDNQCCDNDSYCYINKEGTPKCCPIGSNCVEDSNCGSTAYFCTRTVTVSGTATPRAGCCNRKCPQTSNYLCPSDLGGNCCEFNAQCQAGGGCIETQAPSRPPVLTPVEEGCTTSQFKCADGNGCCDNWQHCTQVSGTGYCAAGNPTDTTISVVEDPSGAGLSDGAKAGIGVAAVVGTSLIVGVAAWLFISRRRQRQQRNSTQQSGSGPPMHDGMTDITSVSRNRPRRGLTQDYFGPDAVPGPFTETAESESATTPGARRAVPTSPHGPSDIAAPVEIDSTVKDENSLLSPMTSQSIQQTPSETIEGRFELYGCDVDVPGRRSSSILRTPSMSLVGGTPRDEIPSPNIPHNHNPRRPE